METLKKALRSKSVWSGIGKLVAGIGLIVTGEQTAQTVIPELLLSVWGIADIIIRFYTDKPISGK